MPAKESFQHSVRRASLQAAIAAGNLAALASRAANRGAGVSIRGRVIDVLAPDALKLLLEGKRVFAVTGTNGKTTTNHFLAAALRRGFDHVVTNADGANLGYGLVSALSADQQADIASLETDERVVQKVCEVGHPEALIILNLSRDQLDRNHEITFLARQWRRTLSDAGANAPLVVATVDDPLVVWAAQGAQRVVWVDPDASWNQDSALCPQCGAVLNKEDSWSCPGCGLCRPQPDYWVRDKKIFGPDDQVWQPQLQVPGDFNIGNAACALAVARSVGICADQAIAAFETVTAPAGRFATIDIAGTSARLLLAKNPAGWAVALPLVESRQLVLAIDSQYADGQDVSWLWDVDYEQLREKFPLDGEHKVIVTGYRGCDIDVRLSYAEVAHELIINLDEAIKKAGCLSQDQTVDVVATYTPFQILRKMGNQK